MPASPVTVYRSSGERGYLPAIRADDRHILARKLEREIDVCFTPVAVSVATQEGVVNARPGDAIITGIAGERWRVSRERFGAKYRPVPPTRAGESGRYVSLPYEVVALPMNADFEVLLADGTSRLRGGSGDWLVDYGDGSLGIVAAHVFPSTYEILR